MLTITRCQARRLAAVFRRHALGLARKGPAPPLVLHADPGGGLRARFQHPALAVEFIAPGEARGEGPVALPLEAPADVAGRDEGTVTLEAAEPGRTVASWADRGIPRSRAYAVMPVANLAPFPGLPDRFEPIPAAVLEALAEAAATTDADSTRYALGCIALRGGSSDLAATDGRQVLIRGGFRWPWAGTVLVRRPPPLAARELPRDRPVEVGKTDAHVVLRAGPWTLWLEIQADARFPDVDRAIPAAGAAATRLRLHPADAAFLAGALDRLPGGELTTAPVTVDCNGKVAVRARGEGEARPTELVLARSGYTGSPARICVNRAFLARAAGLELTELEFGGPEDPVAGRGGGLVYAFQPLSTEGAIGPADDAIRIESGPVRSPSPAVRPGESPKARDPVSERMSRSKPEPPAVGPAGPPDAPGNTAGLAPLIQEAVALHDALGEARARAAHRRAATGAEAVPAADQHPGPAPRPAAPGGRRVGDLAAPGAGPPRAEPPNPNPRRPDAHEVDDRPGEEGRAAPLRVARRDLRRGARIPRPG